MLERNIFNETTDFDVDKAPTEFNNKAMMEKDDIRLKNLTKMVVDATSPETRRIWANKRDEFIRELKWKNTKDQTKGHERTNAI